MRDFDRELDEQGIEEARQMGIAMKAAGLVPQKVICSQAVRARQTLDAINESLHLENDVSFTDTLYATDAPGYLEVAAAADTDADLMLIGHNPMLEDLALALGHEGDEDSITELQMGFRTAGLVVINFEGASSTWGNSNGSLETYMTPADI